MVRVRWLLLGLSLLASHLVAAATLTVRVDKHTLVLGESLVLEVTAGATGLTLPLDNVSLDALHADFSVQDVSHNKYTLSATLYPLRSGLLKIPKLNILSAASAELSINVLESSSTIPRVLLRSGVEPHPPQVRETVLLFLDIYDNGSLVWSAVDPPTAPGLYLRELTASQRVASIDGTNFKVIRHAWAATPLRDGEHTLQFPLLRANKFGARLRYAAPQLKFSARALPAYVPVLVPVAPAPELNVETLAQEIVVNRPVNWRFSVTGAGLSENGLAQIIATTLGAAPGLHFYPLKIEVAAAARSASHDLHDLLAQTFRVTLPFQAQSSGDLELPELSIPYFDPQLEQLATVVLAKQRFTAVSPLRHVSHVSQAALWIVGACITLLALVWPTLRVLAGISQHQRLRKLLQRIEGAQDAHGLKAALLAFDASGAGKRKAFATLPLWLAHTRVTYKMDADLHALLFQLQHACYAANTGAIDFLDLKYAVLRKLKRLRTQGRPLSMWVHSYRARKSLFKSSLKGALRR